ncbi:MAG: kynureninase [Candidatus Dormibacteraeota bacterium]|nr:kynureninase [Candidatus Dormibacteraeota bacterium]
MSTIDREGCADRDRADPLAAFRSRFAIPDGLVYLDGNSLGALPRETMASVETAVAGEWGGGLVRSWSSAGWMTLPVLVGDKIARLVGAGPGEVIVGDSTTVCLYKVVRAALAMRAGRHLVLTETENFHTDLYVADAAARDAEASLLAVPRAELMNRLGDDVAVLLLTHVDYRTGEMHDMSAVTSAAHEVGALVVWDLSHSVGAVPVALGAAGADLAAGCGYKYLNGGPGAPAFMYVRGGLQDDLINPLPGWLGHSDPFAFEPRFRPAAGIRSMVTGTPPVLQLVALSSALDVWLDADMAAVRAKSLELTELFIMLVEQRCAGAGFSVLSPREPSRRGSQVSLGHRDGYGIVQALAEHDVVADFRAPDTCRFGFAPLYLRHVDVWDAVDRLCTVLDQRAHLDPRFAVRAAIT